MCLDDKYSKLLAGGKVYLIEDRLYVEFWNELVPVDKDNIDDIFSSEHIVTGKQIGRAHV